MEFESLVPNIDIEDNNKKPFLDAMSWAISNENNKNIAITGPYGAGKSSLIDTFIKKEEIKDKTVKISIATFSNDTKDATTNNKSQDTDVPLENILEQQILQQLVYKIEPDKIPFSKFTRIFDLDKYKTLATIFFMLIMSLITYSMFKFSWLPKAYSKFISGDLNYTAMIVLIGIFLVAVYTYFIYICILIFQKLGLSKFGFGSTSIEVVTKENNTVFNRYLDEIIYFFKQSKFQYVIFEDLDRFENISIYERLKSLNIILNNTKQLSEQNIVFIYALKDDLFINKDGSHEIYNRTKFFDFIIPTVKIVHSSNAENLLLKRLKREFQSDGKLVGLSIEFIEDIALYINDMRILINICNEYKVYKNALVNNGITADGLFAVVVYKNIYPGDYSSLLSNKGKVYEILNIKDLIINKIKKKIETIQNQIDLGIISETYSSEEIATLFYLEKDLNGITQIDVINSEGITKNTITKNNSSKFKFEGLFESCLELGNDFNLQYHYSFNRNAEIFNGLGFFSISSKMNFLERYRAIYYKEKENSLIREKEDLEEKIKIIKLNSISFLIKNGYMNSEKILDEMQKEYDLLYFLIRNGWIDESYEDYLSYFYEGSLSNNDNKLLKAIRNGLAEDENLDLKNVTKVINRIKIEEISSPSVFNRNLLEFLIENRQTQHEKFNAMVELIFNSKIGKEYYLRFIEYMSDNGNFNGIGALISKANKLGFKVLEDITVNLDTPRKEKYAYSIINSWLFINDKNSLKLMKGFIEQLEPQKIYDNCNIEAIQQMLEDLNIKFKNITSVDGKIKDYVAKHNYFEISSINIQHVIKKVNIKNVFDNDLINEYIKANIKEFIESVILKLGSYTEEEETLISLLNDEELAGSLKYELIKKCNNRIEDISKIDSVKNLISLDKMQCNINNIISLISREEYEEEEVSLDTVLSNKSNWNELLQHKNEINQISVDAFNLITEEFFKSEIVSGKAMENLFKDTERYITVPNDLLESTDENLYDKLSSLIKVLGWDIEVYRFISEYDDNELLLKYLFDVLKNYEYDEIKDDLLHLNSEGLLPWSEELIGKLDFDDEERITYFKHVSSKVTDQFVLDETCATIPLDAELNLKWQGREANTSYFLALANEGIEDSVIESTIEELDYWDIQIFRVLEQFSEKFALSYTKKNEKELFNNSDFSQDEFNILTKGNLSDELIKNLYNFNTFKPEGEFLNWLINEERYTSLLELYNEREIIESYKQQQNISIILYWYINTKKLKREEIYELLSNLKPPFNEIKIGNGNNKKFKYNEWTEKLMKYLEKKNATATVYCNENTGIYVNNKRK
ncbi:hypothetical protein ACQKM9_15740 [Viridibacillus sp. NPDC093762]|uniref:YobI family P-loop NTPase n=1 Tax=Viridibacillus sp. NPDC093762 TaxID=3390720 RepID=UPI003D02E408